MNRDLNDHQPKTWIKSFYVEYTFLLTLNTIRPSNQRCHFFPEWINIYFCSENWFPVEHRTAQPKTLSWFHAEKDFFSLNYDAWAQRFIRILGYKANFKDKEACFLSNQWSRVGWQAALLLADFKGLKFLPSCFSTIPQDTAITFMFKASCELFCILVPSKGKGYV